MAESVETIERRGFPQIAGDPALDLVNTVSWRLNAQRRVEQLPRYTTLIRWSLQFGFIDETDAAALREQAAADQQTAGREIGRVIELREAIYRAAYEGGPTDSVARENAAALTEGHLERLGDSWRWAFPLDLSLPRRRIALAAVDLLTRDDLGLLRQCSDADCGWVFLDSSPRHNRRWCIASDCGNRNRVREHYERTRGVPAS